MTSPLSGQVPDDSAAGPLGVAMIGYAFMGKAHSAAWRTVGSHFDVPAVARRVVVGRNAERTAEAAARYGWEDSSTDWREAIHRDDVDIVDICTPGYLHAEIAIEALKAGKHVLVEKPLANSIAESTEMVSAAVEARERGVQSMVGFNYRRVPALAHARNLIADGRLGAIRQLRVAYLQDWLVDAESPMTWRLRRETAGSGALGDIASHALDQVQFLTGQTVTEVSGRLHTFVDERPGPEGREPVTVDDAAWITAGLTGGAVATVEVSRMATGVKNGLRIEVFGERGALRFDLENLNELWLMEATGPATEQGFRRILVTEPEHPYLDAWWPQGHIIGWEHTFTHQVRDFLTSIRDGRPTQPSFEAGLQIQRVLAAVEESAAARSAVVQVAPATAAQHQPIRSEETA
ncbi:Gfo/Idh/MocA family protein [Arthrobacter sp. MDT2-16]|uniref:Gfo/Idh/MocA family protein n=1 Tax=Arthrobacter ruber TaxID=1258893 RepID=UPI000CF439D0|nr:Gfo/Idh/MocA family oxidoreductase [Arthrobacter ruber]